MGKELPEKTASFARREDQPNTGVDTADNPPPPEPIPEDALKQSDDKNDDVKEKEDHDHQEENKEKNNVGDNQETKNNEEEEGENKNADEETTTTRCRVGEAAIFLFCDLENSIKSDTGKTLVPGGAVHPLSRYTMNYLKYTCEYKDTLEQVFREHSKIERHDSTSRTHNFVNGFDLSNLFESKKKAGSMFTSRFSAAANMAKIESVGKGLSYKVSQGKDFKMRLQGPSEGRKGRLSVKAEVFEVAPEVAVVQFSKSAGDTLEYAKFCEEDVRPALKDIVWTWQGDNLIDNGNAEVNSEES